MNDPKKMFFVSALVFFIAQASLAWGEPVLETASKFSSDIPSEYQNAISKILPGYKILRNEDLVQDENYLSADEIKERKENKSQGIIVGRFNKDNYLDFAAWVVNRSIKKEPYGDMPTIEAFAAKLAVCLGSNTPNEYQCEILPILDGDFIDLPYWAKLKVIKVPGAIKCGDVDHQTAAYGQTITIYYPEGWRGKRPSSGRGEMPARKLYLNYDAIGEYAIGSNGGRTLVRRDSGVYWDCANAD